MADDLFTDTNVLVYSRDTAEPEKQRKAKAWTLTYFALSFTSS